MQYKEQGFIGQLNEKWLRSSCSIAKSGTPTIGAFKIENFGGLIIILLGTFAVSLVILLLETVFCKYWTRLYSINHLNVKEDETEHQVDSQPFQRESNGVMEQDGIMEQNARMGSNGHL